MFCNITFRDECVIFLILFCPVLFCFAGRPFHAWSLILYLLRWKLNVRRVGRGKWSKKGTREEGGYCQGRRRERDTDDNNNVERERKKKFGKRTYNEVRRESNMELRPLKYHMSLSLNNFLMLWQYCSFINLALNSLIGILVSHLTGH